MKKVNKKILSVILIIGLIFVLSGCSSADPVEETSKLFSTISRIEKQNPSGMGFTQEQAEEIIKIIEPVVSGVPFTSDIAEDINKQMDELLTKEQKALIDETVSSLGTQVEGAVPGTGAGGGGGMGMAGASGGTPEDKSLSDSGIGMFLRVDQIITENYLSN